MNTRKINCYAYREGNTLKFQFVEMSVEDTSRLAVIAKGIDYWSIQNVVDTAFAPPREHHANVDPMLLAILGMRDQPELREYINDTIGNRTPEEYKPIILSQLDALTYQHLTHFNQTLWGNFARFNRYQLGSREFNRYTQEIRREYDAANVNAKSYPFYSYEFYRNVNLLPSDATKLLQFVGCIDGAAHSNDIHAPRHGFEIKFYHFDHAPESPNPQDIISTAFKTDAPAPAKQQLSRFLAEFIVKQYKADPEGLAAYKDAAENLEKLLAAGQPSLTKLIRYQLYPDPAFDQFLEEHCKDEPVIAQMLNPKVNYKTASQNVINHLRQLLAKKPSKEEIAKLALAEAAPVEAAPAQTPTVEVAPTEDEILEADAIMVGVEEFSRFVFQNAKQDAADKQPRTFKHSIHEDIATWFKKFAVLKARSWNQYIETLYGHPADDGGYYSSNYTEVTLLRECTLRLHPCGLMEMVFNKDKDSSFDDNYRVGAQNHDILERELRMACDLLGLHFPADIDFHNGPVLFDAESTIELMNRGMHYTEDYCKQLMRSSHHYRLFSPNKKGEENHLIQTFGRDPKALISHWTQPDLHPTEDAEVKTMRIV